MNDRRFDTLTRRAVASGMAAAVHTAAVGPAQAAEPAQRKRRHARKCCPDGSRQGCARSERVYCQDAGLCCTDGSRPVDGTCNGDQPQTCLVVCQTYGGCGIDHSLDCVPGCPADEVFEPETGGCRRPDGPLGFYNVCFAVRHRNGKRGKTA